MKNEPRGFWSGEMAVASCFAAGAFGLHLATNGRYGFFRDELYLLACGEHLGWGYVDHAPLIALFAWFTRAVFGDALQAVRLLPALASAALMLLTGWLTKELGGRRFATGLACLCVLTAPVYLIMHTLFTMNAFEPLFWMGCAATLLASIRRDNPRLLLWFGVLAGLGLMNKHSTLFFGFGLFVGLLLTPARQVFATRWIWIAGAIAALIFLPNLLWQAQHNWPTLEDLSNVRRMHKNIELPPLAFLGQQILMMNPATVLVWAAGVWYLLFHRRGRDYRYLGFAYLVVLGLMMALKGKDYYTAAAYPMLFAAGGAAWEDWCGAWRGGSWLRIAVPGLILSLGLVALPFALPVLPVETLLRYQEWTGIEPPKTEVAHAGLLPQHFGDMFGWPEMVKKVAEVYHALPPEDRAKAAILAGNFGEAGAIDFFGPRYGLPKAISPHQTFFLWGPRDYTGEVVIALQWSRRRAESIWRSVEEGPRVHHPYAMAEEDYAILICRGPKKPLKEIWPSLKHWN